MSSRIRFIKVDSPIEITCSMQCDLTPASVVSQCVRISSTRHVSNEHTNCDGGCGRFGTLRIM